MRNTRRQGRNIGLSIKNKCGRREGFAREDYYREGLETISQDAAVKTYIQEYLEAKEQVLFCASITG